MAARFNLTRADVEEHFPRLETALKFRMLPTAQGKPRQATAGEFMLMSLDGRTAAFKHSDSRNYVYVKDDIDGDPLLSIPTQGNFHGGTFDVFEF